MIQLPMNIAQETIVNVLQILKEEVIPAQGCTEPIAIAFTAAKTKEFFPYDTIKKYSFTVLTILLKIQKVLSFQIVEE